MQTYNFKDFLERYTNVENVKLFDALEYMPDFKEGVWLAGGAIRRTLMGGELSSDFDFFFKDENVFNEFKKQLHSLGAIEMRTTDSNETYRLIEEGKVYTVQLIKISFYKNVEELLNSFDFTISQFAYDGEKLYCGNYSLWDLARKRLALNKLTYGVSTMRRLLKYTNQGFTACSGVLARILEAVVENPETINSDVVSID